jgi:hypothetical protein
MMQRSISTKVLVDSMTTLGTEGSCGVPSPDRTSPGTKVQWRRCRRLDAPVTRRLPDAPRPRPRQSRWPASS